MVSNIQQIVRCEIRLVKVDIKQEAGRYLPSVRLVSAGAAFGLLGLGFLLLSAVYAGAGDAHMGSRRIDRLGAFDCVCCHDKHRIQGRIEGITSTTAISPPGSSNFATLIAS